MSETKTDEREAFLEGCSPAQREFIALIALLDEEVDVDLLSRLVRLTSGEVVAFVTRLTSQGWLRRSGKMLSLDPSVSPEIRWGLAGELSRARAGEFAELLRVQSDIPGRACARLRLHAGDVQAAAAMENDLAGRALEEGVFERAAYHLERVLACLVGDPHPNPGLYVSAALDLSRLRLHTGWGFESVPDLLQGARSVARQMGDRRSLALIRLLEGRVAYLQNRLEDAMQALGEGLDEVELLGDDDIAMRTAEFSGLYFYIQGRYSEAVAFFERALLAASLRGDRLINFFIPIYLGYSAMITGQFNRALGVLDASLRRCQIDADEQKAVLYQAALGMVLVMMNSHRQGLLHLNEARREAERLGNNRGLYFAYMGLSYSAFVEHRIEESYNVALKGATTVGRERWFTWPVGPQWTWPVALEILAVYDELGFAPIPGYEFDRQVALLLEGPNICFRGTMRRILARRMVDGTGGIDQARELLVQSEADMRRAGDALGLAKTQAELARIKLREACPGEARDLALKAWEGLSAYGRRFFPDELMPLLQAQAPRREEGSRGQVLSRFLDMMDAFVPSTDEDELLSLFVAATAQFFGAERGGMFQFDERSPVRLKAGHNLTGRETQQASFRRSLALITRAGKSGQPLLHEGGEQRTPSVLCLPIMANGTTVGVLYHENNYLEHAFEAFDRDTLRRIARHVSAYIERIGGYCHVGEADTRAEDLAGESTEGFDLLTRNAPMTALVEMVDQVAASDASVLILGETGVGKELLARRIHAHSHRREGPFLVVDLACVPENLAESELLGHERGAFTGADCRRRGKLEQAHGGTLFIDEMGEIPLSMQVKLLRVLQEKTFCRVGGGRELSTDFRLVAATNRDLGAEVAAGRFREDLYYRINVVPVEIPPLRERGGDIVLLAEHFIAGYARKYNRPGLRLGPREREVLLGYHWPGNVRELKNIVERSVILSRSGQLELALPVQPRPSSDDRLTEDRPTLDDLQRRYILRVLRETGGRISGPGGAAEILGLKRTTLYTRMKRLKIRLP